MRVLLIVVICLQLLACAIRPIDVPGYPRPLQPCIDKLIGFKHQVALQKISDAQLLWTDAYPHLAFDRFSLSLVRELDKDFTRKQWLNYVTRQATEQRNIEYKNLTDSNNINLSAINDCAEQLTLASASDETWWQQLQQSPPIYPSDYQRWQKVLGLYPVTRLIVAPAIEDEKSDIRDNFKLAVAANAQHYMPTTGSISGSESGEQQIASWFEASRADSDLGWTLLSGQQSSELLNFYAPNWLIETQSDDDKPGKVAYDSDRNAMVDPQQPVMYVYSGYTRFKGQILTQLNYMLWFANRTPMSVFDPYAGKFDAVLVRLTLDRHGQPYIIDTIHSCGCYHMVFSLNPDLSFTSPVPEIEQPVTMQLPDSAGHQSALTVTLSAKNHMVKGIAAHKISQKQIQNKVQSTPLALLPYRQLRSLPFQAQHNKSLFDPMGMLMVSKRAERWFLWPFGVKSPGAMRQTGHHAITFIGERHFDDPFIFDSIFNSD